MTPRQQQTLDFIEKFQQTQPGAAPTLAQIRDAVGIASRGQAHALLSKLETLGAIRRPTKRTLEIVRPEKAEAA